MAQLNNIKNSQINKIPFKDFFAFFLTIMFLTFFAILRFGYAQKAQNKAKAQKAIHKIFVLQKKFKLKTGRYADLNELGFENPFNSDEVIFKLSFKNGISVQAKEGFHSDAFGDGTGGNQYFIGYFTDNGKMIEINFNKDN